MDRELTDDQVLDAARALRAYLRKPDNRGAGFVLNSKGYQPGDRAAILVALGDLEDEP